MWAGLPQKRKTSLILTMGQKRQLLLMLTYLLSLQVIKILPEPLYTGLDHPYHTCLSPGRWEERTTTKPVPVSYCADWEVPTLRGQGPPEPASSALRLLTPHSPCL